MKLLMHCSLIAAFVALSVIEPLAIAKEKAPYDTAASPAAILVTTTMNFDGYKIREYKGIVRGVTVRQPTVGQSFKANLKSIVGGRISPFISMCETARQQSMDVLIERAQALGANAVVGVRYDSSAFGDSNDMGTEVVCYGTAVIVEPVKEDIKQAMGFKQSASLDSKDD
jgi:uncharacterized protein YbjQ (UPF0145 family)